MRRARPDRSSRPTTGRATPLRGEVARRVLGGVLAGAGGTAAMTLSGRVHRRIHARRRGIVPGQITAILDYDDSEHVVIAAAALLRGVTGRAPETPRGRRVLFHLVHWGYGSAFGTVHALLHRRLGEPAGGVAFYAVSQAMALGLFPVLGGTPVPWHWSTRLLVTSFAQHAVYAGAVATIGGAMAARLR